jgi:DNA polymerase-3 subunit gamma/tau
VDIDAGRFVDYTELDAASNRGVDEVQQLLEQAAYKPVQGRFKVFMIDEVHMLSNTAFNAMLKTLEEPPEYLKFVLATTDPHKVPVTVLSRCLQFNLRPMAPETIVEHLTQVLGDEKVQADVQSLRLLARAARGSMRDALSLTDQAIAFGNGALAEAVVRDMLGSVDRSHVFTLIEALAHGDGALVVQTCESLRHLGLSASSLLEEMGMVLQRMAVHQATAQTATSDDPDPDVQRIADLSHLMPADETQLLYSICLHGRADLGLAPDEYAALTMVLLRLLAFKPVHAEAEKKTLKTAPDPVKATLQTNDSDLGEQWLSVVQDLVKAQLIQAMTRELAMQSQLMAQVDGVWHLQVESESLNSASNRERLQLALQSLGHAVTLQVAQGSVQDSPARRITTLQQQRMAQAEADILNHPSVQRLIKEYDAKIIPGTLRLLDH